MSAKRTKNFMSRYQTRFATSSIILMTKSTYWSQTIAPPNHDVHCLSMSLPFVLGLSAKDIAKTGPYLMTDPDNVERWNNMIGKSKARSVGICWRTSSPSVNSAKKSLPLYPILHHLPQGIKLLVFRKNIPNLN